jgi:hypothetical protein
VSVVLTTFCVTHPFHPLLDREFEIAERRINWGVDWVYFHGAEGQLLALRVSWTDLATPDPFVIIAQGRALMRTSDLLRLADMTSDLEVEGV